MNNYPVLFRARVSLPTTGFQFGECPTGQHPPTIGGTLGDLGGTSGGGRQFTVTTTVVTDRVYPERGPLLGGGRFTTRGGA